MKHLRANLVFIFFFLFSAVILCRLFYIQVLQADFYRALAEGLKIYPDETNLTERGEIFLEDGTPLAINWEWPLVFASPPKITDEAEVVNVLSEILNLPQSFIQEKLQKDTLYSPIKSRLAEGEIVALENLNLDGIYLTTERGRYYPKEELASKIVGFLDANHQGQYGLEEFYNDILENESKGTDLALTIDYNIQFMAEKLLKEAKENLEIESGQIIVIEPHTGKILALSDFPNFNPNLYQEYAANENLEVFKNSVTTELFEPGSVFKPFTMAAALNEGKITPQTTYQDPGMLKIDGWPIYNYDGRTYQGEITMTEVLEKSINTGAVFVQEQLEHNVFLEYLKKFGFFEPTGIDLAETFSENKEIKKGREINFATASFGQGVEMTPIQLVRAFSAIANGGKLIRPYLVEKFSADGETVKTEPETSSSVISQKTVSQLIPMLISVVENGFAKSARIPGYYVAGKTGTAQVAFSSLGIEKSGYSEKTIQSFVGFAPAFNPRFLILVRLENPKTKTAEYSAVPIFHDLAKYIVDYWQIPPDYQVE